MDPAILTFDTAEAAADACGARIMEIIEKARRDRGSAAVALSGGSTPRIMFQWMAKRRFDWSGIEFFQVDERCVPPDDSQSNFRMTRESLLDPAGIPESQFHRVAGRIAAHPSCRDLHRGDLPDPASRLRRVASVRRNSAGHGTGRAYRQLFPRRTVDRRSHRYRRGGVGRKDETAPGDFASGRPAAGKIYGLSRDWQRRKRMRFFPCCGDLSIRCACLRRSRHRI